MRRRNAGQTSSESYLSASHTLASESALRLGGIRRPSLANSSSPLAPTASNRARARLVAPNVKPARHSVSRVCSEVISVQNEISRSYVASATATVRRPPSEYVVRTGQTPVLDGSYRSLSRKRPEFPKLHRLDLQSQILRVHATLGQTTGNEPQAFLQRTLEHVVEYTIHANAPERRKSALCPALRRTGGKGPLKVSRADCHLEPGQRMMAYLPQCGVTPRSPTPAQPIRNNK